ncbi:MAG: hypothetical protein RL708_1262 [Bacteroidota bacterium]|jgi:uncharacterized protein YndB with AHSA1/START domain
MSKKKAFTLEYIVKSSPSILYDFISTTSGLAQWFADRVDSTQKHWVFEWNGSEEEADLIESVDREYVKFRWTYQDKTEYFELRIKVSDISRDTILMVTDFADPKEMKDTTLLWDSTVKTLRQHIGGLG